MDCQEAQEQFSPYLLGALDSEELFAMDRHIGRCVLCGVKLRAEGQIITDLAYGVPQLKPPARIKHRLLARIKPEAAGLLSAKNGLWRRLVADLAGRRSAQMGMAVASLAVVVLVPGGVWINGRLEAAAERNEALSVAAAVTSEPAVALQDQLYLAYTAAVPGMAVEELSATRRSDDARGMFLVPKTGDSALVAVLGLPALPRGFAYRVWLIADGRRYSAGSLTVDSTGYGYTNIKLFAPLAELDAIAVTIERVDESERGDGISPGTGRTVLRGDL
jgi:hypothetical protein